MTDLQQLSEITRKWGGGFITLVVGVAILALALPRVGAASGALPAATAIFGLEQGQTFGSQTLAGIEDDLQTALSYEVETAELNSQLSYLSLRRLLANKQNVPSRDEYQSTLVHVENALKRRPLDAYLWTRYAHLSYLLGGLSPYTLAALDKSFQYGPQEKQLFQFRMTICMLEWERLPAALRESAHRQIAFGATHPRIWGYILADLPEKAGEKLLTFLASAGADVTLAQRIAAGLQRNRSQN